MFCSKCGKQIQEGNSFCEYCGTAVLQASQPEQPIAPNNGNAGAAPSFQTQPPVQTPAPQYQPQAQPGSAYAQYQNQANAFSQQPNFYQPTAPGSHGFQLIFPWMKDRINFHPDSNWYRPEMNAVIGTNQQKYLMQFDNYANGRPVGFRWIAFFLSIFHAFYRNTWKECLCYIAPPMIVYAIGSLAGALTVATFNPVLLAITCLISFVGFVFTIINAVLYGKDYNAVYFRHVHEKVSKGDFSTDVSVGRCVLGTIIVCVITSAEVLLSTYITDITLALLLS